MNSKNTDELLEIWQRNHRFEWSDEAFDVVIEILKERGVEIPAQNEPVNEQLEEENQGGYDITEVELKIINDNNPPAFYDPYEVLLLTKRLDWMITITITFIIVQNILNYPPYRDVAVGFFPAKPNSIVVYGISTLLALANAALSIIVIYIPLKVLARILRILMEMEFRSRKASY
jgi:hypothetical protein